MLAGIARVRIKVKALANFKRVLSSYTKNKY